MRHEIIFPTHTLSRYEKKIGVILHPKALQWILYRHVFYPYMLCITRARTHGHLP